MAFGWLEMLGRTRCLRALLLGPRVQCIRTVFGSHPHEVMEENQAVIPWEFLSELDTVGVVVSHKLIPSHSLTSGYAVVVYLYVCQMVNR